MSRLAILVPGILFAGEYSVVRLLSEGGMGAVYVAVQKSTGRERALKVMHPDLVRDPAARRRFEQEARVSAHIKSNHIVEVIAAGVEEPEGMPWLAMELLEGMDLASTLKQRGPLPLDMVSEIFGQLCHALSAAHAAGVVHRDLKPENIFMTVAMQEGMPFLVKVLDFGIAKVVGEAHTQATGAIGTPHWMAPEQTVPGSEISFAADIWPLGLIAFRLLTGRMYWRGDSPMAVLREVAFEPLEKASVRAQELGCGGRLPSGFDAWFERCVAREPRARFRSAAEAREAFEAMASGQVLPAFNLPAPELDPLQGSMSTAEWLARQDTREDTREDTAAEGSASAAPAESTISAEPTTSAAPASTLPDSSTAQPPRRSMRTLGIGAAAVLAAALATVVFAMRSGKECPSGHVWNGTACVAMPECAPGMHLDAAHRCVPLPAPVASAVAVPAKSAAAAVEKPQVTAPACPVGMVAIPGGSFRLGDRGDTATVAPFCMDATEVTVEAYTACVRAGSCSEEGLECSRATYGSTTKKDRPINCVSWNQAQTYCKRKGRRLPSEEEWEWEARGGAEARVYPWGNDAPSNQLCWVGEGSTLKNVDLGPCPVGSYPAGATVHGVMDMSGNLYEWTSTLFSPKAAHRTCRGGSWQAETSTLVSAANRLKCAPGQHLYNVGFRCAASM